MMLILCIRKGASMKNIRHTQVRWRVGKLDIYCYFHRNSAVKPGQTRRDVVNHPVKHQLGVESVRYACNYRP